MYTLPQLVLCFFVIMFFFGVCFVSLNLGHSSCFLPFFFWHYWLLICPWFFSFSCFLSSSSSVDGQFGFELISFSSFFSTFPLLPRVFLFVLPVLQSSLLFILSILPQLADVPVCTSRSSKSPGSLNFRSPLFPPFPHHLPPHSARSRRSNHVILLPRILRLFTTHTTTTQQSSRSESYPNRASRRTQRRFRRDSRGASSGSVEEDESLWDV